MTAPERFRKKPVEVEAMRYTVTNGDEVAKWCGGSHTEVTGGGWQDRFPVVRIPTLEGVMVAVDGDWIIRGVKGEFYPCKPDIFAETYEPVVDDE